jgi:UDP-3-O-[3-hydroxymyristoyl] glucosamine N-acyltransferase
MKTIIDPTAEIHPTAWINPENVIIEKNVVIGPLSAIGIHSLVIEREYIVGGKRIRKDLEGQLIIKENSDIGPLNAISLGSKEDGKTIIDKNVIIGSSNIIAHDVFFGEGTLMIGNCTIAGYVQVGTNCRIGPNSAVREHIKIGNRANISMGSIVTQDVEPGQRVTGNFAIDHEMFLSDLKERTSKLKNK